jgi:hypothetical protein
MDICAPKRFRISLIPKGRGLGIDVAVRADPRDLSSPQVNYISLIEIGRLLHSLDSLFATREQEIVELRFHLEAGRSRAILVHGTEEQLKLAGFIQ